eukprot:gnl/MRDRNA2_/MRDRNA2_85702_c5_seq10.p1 gnl/MRDRNA2_/MRDRNA2_85702_c5~~gnl/MRDRNA2_/MRDRNA2_85702_c5_seq10.p1  ORF type:complete len:127 (-),score=22.02 gnl/MRDRNA2_/MRDRNA2_85702_c5_seq10:62-442(-)
MRRSALCQALCRRENCLGSLLISHRLYKMPPPTILLLGSGCSEKKVLLNSPSLDVSTLPNILDSIPTHPYDSALECKVIKTYKGPKIYIEQTKRIKDRLKASQKRKNELRRKKDKEDKESAKLQGN